MTRRLLGLFLVGLVLGCGGGSTESRPLEPTSTNVAGTYTMVSANGTLLPYTAFITSTEQWQLRGDKIVISDDNTWTETTSYLVFQLSDGSSFARETAASGTYSIASGQINFVMTVGGAETFAGSVTGSALTLLYGGRRILYTR